MKKILVLIPLILFLSNTLFGQEKESKQKEIGILYFGELGLHPGIEIDYLFNLYMQQKIKEKRTIKHQINIRPSLTYYHLPEYTNNFLFTPNLNYNFSIINNKKQRYFFLEPYFKFGYMRYSYIGQVYQTTSTGFEKKKLGGGNAGVFGGGLGFGGSIKPNKLDWVFGSEYLAELSEDALFVNHLNFKLGIRYKFKKK